MRATLAPGHLLFLHQTFAHDLIHGGLYKTYVDYAPYGDSVRHRRIEIHVERLRHLQRVIDVARPEQLFEPFERAHDDIAACLRRLVITRGLWQTFGHPREDRQPPRASDYLEPAVHVLRPDVTAIDPDREGPITDRHQNWGHPDARRW